MPEPITSASASRSKRATRVCILARKKLSRNTRVFKQAKALSQAGYDVTIIAIREEGLASYEEREHWRIHRIGLLGLGSVLFPLTLSEKLLLSLRRKWRGKTKPSEDMPPSVGSDRSTPSASVRRGASVMSPSGTVTRAAQRPSAVRLAISVPRGLVVRIGTKMLGPVRQIDFLLRSLRILIRHPHDVYHCHDSYPLLTAYVASRIHGARFIYDGVEFSPDRNAASGSRMGRIWHKVEGYIIRRADAVTTVGESAAALFARTYKIEVPTPIMNCSVYQEIAPSNLPQSRLDVGDRRIALYVGGMTINRGLEQLVLASRSLEDVVVVIIGPILFSGYDSTLRALIREVGVEDRVFLMEPVAPEEVITMASSAHLGVIPVQRTCLSHTYTIPNKLFECIMARLPIATADMPNVRHIVESQEIGLVFDERDPESMADTIRAILSDDSLYQKMKENLDRCARIYCWEREAEKLLRVYANLDT